jgi:hypothetical protein
MSSHVARQATAHTSPAVTPNDSADLPGGRSRFTSAWRATCTIRTAPASSAPRPQSSPGLFPCEVKRVYSTGTTATGILALYTKGS